MVFFAHWRWGTLSRSCQSLEELLPLLYDRWSSFPFLNKLRDAVGVGHAKNAVFSKKWMGEFKFTSWFANIWAGLQSWGSVCRCHEEELTSGKKIVCPLWILDAWLKVQTTLNAMKQILSWRRGLNSLRSCRAQ